ncbi:MAG: hypothetical protein V4795_10510 [Pseudomonadota bacterium]
MPAWLRVSVLAGALAACGGGGGGGGSGDGAAVDDNQRPPLPTLSRDDDPSAPRLAVGPDDYLPQADVLASFDRLDSNGQRLGLTTLRLTRPAPDSLRLTETEDGQFELVTDLRRTAAGWAMSTIPNNQLPAAVNDAIGSLLQLPSPFHAIGSIRVQYRSGSYGVDLDGDGVHESFEFEYRQRMVGEEAVAGPHGPITALHIRDDFVLTVLPSRRSLAPVQATDSSDYWLARGLGFVREQVRSVDGEGGQVFPPYALALTALQIAGIDALDPSLVRDLRSIALVHRDLVYDAARRVYYASVPGSVPGQGNRLASIDATTGAVSYSAVVGADPGALALAADGASLHVALDGSSEVLRLALPGLAELSRTRLPLHPLFGSALQVQALAASPTSPGVVAVALAMQGASQTHAGVALLRDGLLMPVQTAPFSGANQIVFGADGNSLFGINTESTEFGLRRIAVQADGLVVQQVRADAFASFYISAIDRTGQRLVLANRIVDADSLAPLGQIAGASECRVLTSTRLACTTGFAAPDQRLLLADPVTAQVVASLRLPADSTADTRRLVAGPSGQLAVRDQIAHPAQRDASRVLLVQHAALP